MQNLNFLMAIYTRDNSKKTKNQAKENSRGQMDLFMKDNLKVIELQDMVSLNG